MISKSISIIFFFLFISHLKLLSQDNSTAKPFLQNINKLNRANEIYDLDVFKYYELEQYDTALKKKNFKRTTEYLVKYDSLKALRKVLLNTFSYINVSMDGQLELSDYIIGQGGFNISLYYYSSPKTIEDIYFPSLPSKRIKEILSYREILFIKVNEEVGTKMENIEEISFYLIFKITGKQKVSYKNGWRNISQEHLYADNVKLIITDDKTGEIFFEKEY